MLWDEEWRKKKGLLLKKEKIYVLRNKELRMEIIHLHHDTPIAGHEG